MFQRMLVATGLGDGVHRLKDCAAPLAQMGIEQLTILHVVPPLDTPAGPREDGDRMALARAALETSANPRGDCPLQVEVVVESGPPVDTILRVAQERGSEVIVLGTPTRSLLNEKLFGSTTLGICQRTPIPVMTLRPQLLYTYTQEELALRCQHLFRQVLLPYDGTEASQRLVEKLQGLKGGEHGMAVLHLCWVVDTTSQPAIPKDGAIAQAQQDLAQAQTRLAAAGFEVKTQVRQGTPVLEVLQVAETEDISAIALSSGSLAAATGLGGMLKQLSVPSFAAELLRRSWFPLLYIPGK
jgi:nucleotide-binding universal stress UspA family protein